LLPQANTLNLELMHWLLPAFDKRFQVLEMFGIPALFIGEAFPARNVAEHLEAVVVEFNERGSALRM
jgi:hypothetical protein